VGMVQWEVFRRTLMHIAFKIIPLVLYLFIGIVALLMAYKSFFSSRFLPFHEQAAGKSWESIDQGVQIVIRTLMKVSGLGFLTVALFLIIFSIVSFFSQYSLVQCLLPGIALLFCLGLFVVNHQLAVQTKAKTPWKGSLTAAVFIGIGIILSLMK
jgi:4-amino-4-deoxy-L-arabinose transferase-like glycosyltransferase